MARGKDNKNQVEQAKEWLKNDTAKAVATVVAVLLIPAAVIAYNYASSGDAEVEEPVEETMQEAEDEDTVEEVAQGEEEVSLEDVLAELGSEEEPEEAMTEESTQGEQAVGGLDSLESLPNTASAVPYTVQKGDNVYKISNKICGDNSYYLSNMKTGYLKVGQAVQVVCQ